MDMAARGVSIVEEILVQTMVDGLPLLVDKGAGGILWGRKAPMISLHVVKTVGAV
jgi:hypothetical protein